MQHPKGLLNHIIISKVTAVLLDQMNKLLYQDIICLYPFAHSCDVRRGRVSDKPATPSFKILLLLSAHVKKNSGLP